MSFLDQISLATDPNFINRVQQAAVKTAIAVSAESTSGNSDLDTTRLNFSTRVLHSPQSYSELIAYGVATNGSISSSSSDNDIEFTVISMWNAYAGVNANQL